MTKTEKKTADNRTAALTDLHSIISYAEQELVHARKIPALDDEEHADLIQGYADRINEILWDMYELDKFFRLKCERRPNG